MHETNLISLYRVVTMTMEVTTTMEMTTILAWWSVRWTLVEVASLEDHLLRWRGLGRLKWLQDESCMFPFSNNNQDVFFMSKYAFAIYTLVFWLFWHLSLLLYGQVWVFIFFLLLDYWLMHFSSIAEYMLLNRFCWIISLCNFFCFNFNFDYIFNMLNLI